MNGKNSVLAVLLLAPLICAAPKERNEGPVPASEGYNETRVAKESETQRERAPETQPPQVTFPFPLPFFPLRPDASQPPAMPQLPFTFPFPFLFPSFVPRPTSPDSVRSVQLDSEPEDYEPFNLSGENQMRRNPSQDKKKQKKKKKQQQKKPKTPKPMVIYQKDDQIALEGSNAQPGFAGQLVNGNQGSYLGYYMVYLVQVTWNGSNQTQTIIAGRPILTRPTPTESAQITDLSGALITDKPSPAITTQCLFQRSTTAGSAGPPEPTDKPANETGLHENGTNNEQEVISEEMETMEEYDEDEPKKKKKKKTKKKVEKNAKPEETSPTPTSAN